jgi:single-strand DNA-binding protein
MNNLNFDGRLAKAPALTGSGDRAYTRFTLIRNEYAGKDDQGESMERQVSLQFTAFRGMAEAIAKNFMKGDQMIVTARVENNNYPDKESGEIIYGTSFILESFDYGAPGPAKRAELAKRQPEEAAS